MILNFSRALTANGFCSLQKAFIVTVLLSFHEMLGLARNHCGYKNETVPREPPIIVTEYLSTKLSSIMYLNCSWEAVMQTNVSVSVSVYFERQNFLGYFWLG